MNEPLTLGSLLQLYLAWVIGGSVAAPVLIWALMKPQRPECPTCHRGLHWRARKPSLYASRWWCPFHDETT